MITAGPGWPGRGPSAYQAAAFPPLGCSIVPSPARPTRSSVDSTPMAGIRTRTGTATDRYVRTERNESAGSDADAVGDVAALPSAAGAAEEHPDSAVTSRPSPASAAVARLAAIPLPLHSVGRSPP